MSESIFSGSDGIESELTTLPCTTITEIPKSKRTKPRRYQHDIIGWSPDIGNVQKYASGDHVRAKPPPSKLQECRPRTSSVYMMNYENKSLLESRPKVMQKAEPPSGFAVPVRASAPSASLCGPSKVFSSPLPVYQLRANPLHRATFYKCVFQTIEKLDRNEMHHATWMTANVSPRLSVLHLSCNTGAVTAVNLATGQCVQNSISADTLVAASERSELFNVVDESVQMMKLGTRYTSAPKMTATTPSTQPSDYGDKYVETWGEVQKDLTNLQQMFGGEYTENFHVYRTDDDMDYQREILRQYAPVIATPTVTNASIETTIGEEESEMQMMTPSEDSEFERNVHFRRSFEKVFRGRYEPDGPIDRWLQMMTDESVSTYTPKKVRNRRFQTYDVIAEDDEEEEDDQSLQRLPTCENARKQQKNETALPRTHQAIRKSQVVKSGGGDSTIRAASSTSGSEESFALIPV